MGALISKVQEELEGSQKKTEDYVKENLRQCEETAKMVASTFRLQVQERYKNPGEFNKWQIAGGRQDREDIFIGVSCSTAPSTDLSHGVKSLVKGIFGVVEGGAGSKFLAGVMGMADVACNTFLGNAAAGSSTHSTFLIIPHGFAFYRVDILMYKYTFTSTGFTEHYNSQIVVYASRAILGSQDLLPDELVSYVSDMTDGDEAKMKQWLKSYRKLQKLAQEIKRPIKSPTQTSDEIKE